MLTGRRISWRLACFPCTCEGKESCTVRGKKCVHKLIALFRFSHTDLIQWSPDWPAIFRKSQLGTAYSILCCSLLSSHLILLSCTRQLLQMVLVPKFPLGISCLPWDYGIYDQAWQWSGMKKGGCGAEWKVLHQDSCQIWPMSWSLEAPTLKQRFSTFFSQISVYQGLLSWHRNGSFITQLALQQGRDFFTCCCLLIPPLPACHSSNPHLFFGIASPATVCTNVLLPHFWWN